MFVCLSFCFMQHLEAWYITFNSLPEKHVLAWTELAGTASLTLCYQSYTCICELVVYVLHLRILLYKINK